MAELAQAQSILKETLDKVAALEAQFDEANTKKVLYGQIFQAWHKVWWQTCTCTQQLAVLSSYGGVDVASIEKNVVFQFSFRCIVYRTISVAVPTDDRFRRAHKTTTLAIRRATTRKGWYTMLHSVHSNSTTGMKKMALFPSFRSLVNSLLVCSSSLQSLGKTDERCGGM